MEIPLHYGESRIVVQIPKENIAGIIHPRDFEYSFQGGAEAIKCTFDKTASGFSENIKGRTVGVLLPDGTRDIPPEVILRQLFPLLTAAQRVLFFICTGTHPPETPENQAIINRIQSEARNVNLQTHEIIAHDCRDAEFISAGTTLYGTEIRYNARLQEPEAFVVLSDVKPHYFAGYSNPIKYFVPGLCAFKTAEDNHSWTMDERSCAGVHPWHPDPALCDNPLSRDQLEAMTTIIQARPVWAVVTLSSDGRIQWADFGLVQEVTPWAFLKADAWNCFMVGPVRKMIVSPGGLPNDVDLYIAQRALELTADVVCDGGEILFLSACPKGVGSARTTSQFYDKLIVPLDEIEAAGRDNYQLYSHKPWRFARLIRRLNRLWLYSQIDASEIRKMHMTPTAKPQDVVTDWLAQDPREKILVVDEANKLLLRSQSITVLD